MDERVTVRMTAEMISRLDEWIATGPGYVSRQDVVRRCVELVLERPELRAQAPRDATVTPDHTETRQDANR